MKNDWVREKFSIFETKTYINSCSYGALSTEVKQAFTEYLTGRDQEGALWMRWCDLLEELRAEVAGLLNASPDEIAITGSASNGVNSVVSALDFTGTRNKVVTTDYEFPSVAQIWHAQKSQGATIHSVAEQGLTVSLAHFDQALDDKTQLVSLSQVCYRNGSAMDIRKIRDMARDRGALVMLDSFQMIGTQSVDVKELDVDFLVGGFLKYLLGTAGIAFLYVKKELLPSLNPTATGWFAQKDIHAMDIRGNKPADTARKFETGTPPVANIYAALAGIKLIRAIGLDNIGTHVGELTTFLKEEAKKRGWILATPEDARFHGPMIALKSHDDHALVAALAEEDIIVSCRDNNLRVSPHIYNNLSDMEKLVAVLQKNSALLS